VLAQCESKATQYQAALKQTAHPTKHAVHVCVQAKEEYQSHLLLAFQPAGGQQHL
jgi:hypothetical protein